MDRLQVELGWTEGSLPTYITLHSTLQQLFAFCVVQFLHLH